jgi:4-methylaminobutanoate oxidase (formaldehyde-forming)
VFDLLMEAGRDRGLALAGYHALDTLRSEKGYRSWGHDITPAETPLEAGLGFTVAFGKAGDFNGRAALERQRARGVATRLLFFELQDPCPMLIHDEPIRRDGEIVGRITSGAYGHTLGASIGMGYVTLRDDAIGRPLAEYAASGNFEIEIAADCFPADASARPFYDPSGARLRL